MIFFILGLTFLAGACLGIHLGKKEGVDETAIKMNKIWKQKGYVGDGW